MVKRILPLALLSAVIISNIGCKSNGGFKKVNGIEYKIVKDTHGKNAIIGDVIEINIRGWVDTGTGKNDTLLLGDTWKQNNGNPIQMPVENPRFVGDFKAVFTHLSAGDSAIVIVSVDTMIASMHGQRTPSFFKPNHKITYVISVVSVKSMDEFKKDMDAKAAVQAQADDKILQDYFAKNNLKPEKTASGIYYTITQQGTGDFPKPGQTVSVMYTGKTLDGKTFDSNVDPSFKHTDPIEFAVGEHKVIPGWDEGITLIKKGGKATLYIPSTLAYGAQGSGPIPPNSQLMFDVELLDIKDAK